MAEVEGAVEDPTSLVQSMLRSICTNMEVRCAREVIPEVHSPHVFTVEFLQPLYLICAFLDISPEGKQLGDTVMTQLTCLVVWHGILMEAANLLAFGSGSRAHSTGCPGSIFGKANNRIKPIGWKHFSSSVPAPSQRELPFLAAADDEVLGARVAKSTSDYEEDGLDAGSPDDQVRPLPNMTVLAQTNRKKTKKQRAKAARERKRRREHNKQRL
ncbi:hypothetical protein CGGC5_v008640 [Colletotrichum fructicola Nara gc5]|uniref:Uncharacterized protein n=1 Tax=Colletotrichum fructicola (strain Nara gc5) TaxID=1213859 RepID=A0A7J6J3I7_COLFN|nr:hypothetical protein CGGC5_v008640 [Colletotrichum fructicola Nara gc5]